MRSVCLVSGPPCAGKSTFVGAQGRRPGDLVADFDEMARRLGSPGKWMQSTAVGDAADREMDRLADVVAGMAEGRAWIIRCAPDPVMRGELAEHVRADRVVVLLPPLGVLMARAARRPLAHETRRAILRWRDRYAPREGDELIREVPGAVARP